MKFGVVLRNLTRAPVPEARQYMLEVAKAADELGFYSVWVPDHVVIPLSFASVYPYGRRFPYSPDDSLWEPLTVLAGMASITRHVRLGTTVLVLPLRHPIYAAKVLATLDCLSGGRVILGAGIGWLKEEMAIMGTPTRQIGALTDEHLLIYKALWTQDEPKFEGRWYRFSGFTFLPRPVQKPHPPIWIGGASEAALRRVVRLGDGWHAPSWSPWQMAPALERLRQLCQEAGRRFEELDISTGPLIIVDPQAKSDTSSDTGGLQQRPYAPIQGNPDQLAKAIETFRDTGVTHFVSTYTIKDDRSGLPSTLRALEVFAKEVMPRFT